MIAARPHNQNKTAVFFAAAAAALLLALAMPGLVGWWPLLFAALVPLLYAVPRLSLVESGCMGMLCGLLHHLSLLYWIVIVLDRYGGLPFWQSAGALLLLALYMAVYTALFCMILNLLARLPEISPDSSSAAVLLAAPAVWVGLDVLRGRLLTGLPWMDLGYGLYRQPIFIQAADLGGHHLITYCLVQINALLFWLLARLFRRAEHSAPLHRSKPALMVCLLLYCIGGYSCLRLQQISAAEVQEMEQISAVVVQGNIDQNEKWHAGLKAETVAKYLSLSSAPNPAAERTDLIVWPETALPFVPLSKEPLMSRVRGFAADKQINLLTGAPYINIDPHRENPVEYSNSALMLDRTGAQTGRYSKQHLVPFGEYVPLRKYLWFIKPLVELVGDFTPGSSSEPLAADQIRAGILICFESVFPDIARRETAAGANVLVNMTNDAWYGRSSAPHHSWAMSVLRAVENRRSLIRAANTGISGFVEPTGIIAGELPLFQAATLNRKVLLNDERTLFVRGGHWFGPACLLLTLSLTVFSAAKKLRSRRRKRIIQKKPAIREVAEK